MHGHVEDSAVESPEPLSLHAARAADHMSSAVRIYMCTSNERRRAVMMMIKYLLKSPLISDVLPPPHSSYYNRYVPVKLALARLLPASVAWGHTNRYIYM